MAIAEIGSPAALDKARLLDMYAGIYPVEMFHLDPLVADYAEDGVDEFLFAAPPLTMTGGAGAPINPQAMK
jgi:hypothetical protein